MIDKTMNCTADESQKSTGPVYGVYMDGLESIVFSERADWGRMEDFKWIICRAYGTFYNLPVKRFF